MYSSCLSVHQCPTLNKHQSHFLEQHLAQKPLENWLSQISFRYAGKEISIANIGYYKFVEFFIRKGAHFGTYFLLGGLTSLGLAHYWPKLGHVAFTSWMLATLYAGTDELHQMFTSDRTPLIQDVILDSCGALLGVMFAMLLLYRSKKTAKWLRILQPIIFLLKYTRLIAKFYFSERGIRNVRTFKMA